MAADPQPPLPTDPMDALVARVGEHAAQLELLGLTVAGHDERLAELGAAVESLLPDNAGQGHTPIPSPRWHDLEGQARTEAIDRLRDWVRRVYVPCTATWPRAWPPAGRSTRWRSRSSTTSARRGPSCTPGQPGPSGCSRRNWSSSCGMSPPQRRCCSAKPAAAGTRPGRR